MNHRKQLKRGILDNVYRQLCDAMDIARKAEDHDLINAIAKVGEALYDCQTLCTDICIQFTRTGKRFNVIYVEYESDEEGKPVDIVIRAEDKETLTEIAEYVIGGCNLSDDNGVYTALFARLEDFTIEEV